MAIWKDIVAKDSPAAEPVDPTPAPVVRPRPEAVAASPASVSAPVTRKDSSMKESVIASGLTFEGKIDG
ncbi:MAG TPA: hypothetical protein VFM30_01005, partial [Steroidobacteraceae bacterium]|nr:hypothetical protein [Steroidobacteraceae bacterium]